MKNETILTQWWKSSWAKAFETGLVWLSIFLIPWQLRHTVYFAEYGGNYFEYPSMHIYATDAVMAGLLLIWWLRGGRNTKVPKLIWGPLLLWLAWMTVGSATGIDWQNSLQQSAHYWLMAGWLIYLVNNIKSLTEIIWPLAWGALVQAGVGMTQFFVNHDLGLQLLGESPLGPNQGGVMVVGDELHRQIRAYGLLPHPNMLGGWLAFGIIPVAWLWTQTKRYRWLVLATVGLMGMGLVAAFSRMSWLLAGMALVVWIGLVITKRWDKTARWPITVLGLAMGLMLWWQWPMVTGRFELDSSLEQKSVNERVVGLQQFGTVMTGHWFAGLGVGNYASALIAKNPDQLVWTYKPVHNIFLLMLAETGAVGLAIWGWMIGIGVWLWWKTIRRDWSLIWVGVPLVVVLFSGLLDHWAVSFQQGRLLVFLALALIIWSNQSIFRSVNR